MIAFLTIVHVLVCMALIGIVLLQQGKGADMGAAFGGSSQTLFGSSGGATFLGKLTAGAAVMFMITSLGLGLMHRAASDGAGSVIEEDAVPAQSQTMDPPPPAPATPAAPTAPAGEAKPE